MGGVGTGLTDGDEEEGADESETGECDKDA